MLVYSAPIMAWAPSNRESNALAVGGLDAISKALSNRLESVGSQPRYQTFDSLIISPNDLAEALQVDNKKGPIRAFFIAFCAALKSEFSIAGFDSLIRTGS